MKIVDDIEKAWADKQYDQLASYAKRLRDPDLRGLPPHVLSMLGVGSAIVGKHKVALRPLWFAHQLNPESINARLNLGNCMKDLGDYRGAYEIYTKDLAGLDDPLIVLGAGICALETSQFADAEKLLSKALQKDANNVVALLNYGRLLYRLERIEDAASHYKKALEIQPTYAAAAINLSICFIKQGDYDHGVSLALQVLKSGYENDEYLKTLLSTCLAAGSAQAAMLIFENCEFSISDESTFVAAEAYRYHKDHAKTEELCRKIIKSNKDFFSAYIIMALSMAELGDAEGAKNIVDAAFARCNLDEVASRHIPNPWTIFAIEDSPALQLKVAKRYAAAAVDIVPRSEITRAVGKRKLSIGYLSPDFRQHPVAECMLPVLKGHDPDNVDVHCFSLAEPEQEDSMTCEIEAAAGAFHRCSQLMYPDFKKLMQENSIDVLVDLAVYTSIGRPSYLALGCAPMQINHLGYSGTSGSNAYDFIIADEFIVPEGNEHFYSEKMIKLSLPIISSGLSATEGVEPQLRSLYGLEDDVVIFGCMANPYKFSHALLKGWAKILLEVPRSVLMFGNMTDRALEGIRGQLKDLGVMPSRLIPSGFQPSRNDHIARLKLVDVFLDTFPYNAHSLAADAISAGVPLVTLNGKAFASRVAGSLNHYLGLDELNAGSMDQYVENACRLAHESEWRQTCRATIQNSLKSRDWGKQYALDLETKILEKL